MDIQVISFNIHKGIGWGAHSASLSKIHSQLKLAQPDLIFLQEIRGTHFEELADAIWPHSSYGRNAIYQKGHHGNAILSKYPIKYSENINISMSRYEKRGLLYCVTEFPNLPYPLHLLCVHLGLLKKFRSEQLKAIVDFIVNKIPENELIVLAGDFNDWNRHATQPLVNELGLSEAFLNIHGAYAKTFPSWAPMLRLDRVYSRGFHIQNAHRLNHKPWKYLSDHLGLNVELRFTGNK